jgi:methylated-DNA-[protein]-cysteine S-methyltransferase
MSNALAQLLHHTEPAPIFVAACSSPLGPIHIATANEGLCAVVFEDRLEALQPRLRRVFGPFFTLADGDPLDIVPRLTDYLAGDLTALSAVALSLPATPMQRRVWEMARAIPAGTTTTYVSLAERLGMPRAQRAVGVCLASNPVPMFIPCHRVIAASGGLGSHPGGMMRKRWLLRHEGVDVMLPRASAPTLRKQASRVGALDPNDRVELIRWPRFAVS